MRNAWFLLPVLVLSSSSALAIKDKSAPEQIAERCEIVHAIMQRKADLLNKDPNTPRPNSGVIIFTPLDGNQFPWVVILTRMLVENVDKKDPIYFLQTGEKVAWAALIQDKKWIVCPILYESNSKVRVDTSRQANIEELKNLLKQFDPVNKDLILTIGPLRLTGIIREEIPSKLKTILYRQCQ